MKNQKLKVLELFAGVGGFRLGLERADENLYQTLWANQWEPSRKRQDAFECYSYHFKNSINIPLDINQISDNEFKSMNVNMIVGGFPCQDYSVARTISNEKGIEGKKGVLFWQIIRAVENIGPDYLLLENVDRLLKSPAKQRGRDFLIMLSAFNNLGYSVEWRVINAAEYGFPQKRRRVFLLIYRNDSKLALQRYDIGNREIIKNEGVFAKAFPVSWQYIGESREGHISPDLAYLSEQGEAKFHGAGVMTKGEYYTTEVEPAETKFTPLQKIILPLDEVDSKFYLTDTQLDKMKVLRNKKTTHRIAKNGFAYSISEGKMALFDNQEKPGRTVITSEGTVNRSTHIIRQNGIPRFLTPIEVERMNGFPDDWTLTMPDRMRYFCMGNALIVGIVERIGKELKNQLGES